MRALARLSSPRAFQGAGVSVLAAAPVDGFRAAFAADAAMTATVAAAVVVCRR